MKKRDRATTLGERDHPSESFMKKTSVVHHSFFGSLQTSGGNDIQDIIQQ
jgi:hypothetical protein